MGNFNSPMKLDNILINDNFWKHEIDLMRNEVIPYQWEALNDRIEGAEKSYAMKNFKIAAKLTKQLKENGIIKKDEADVFRGFVFQDSDFAKWIEAVGYSLAINPDENLQKIADEAIDIVCQAQQENGYLDTYYIINGMDKAFTNLRDNHELYCFGHFIEGAIAYYEATKNDKLLKAMEKYADYIYDIFGNEDSKIKGYPGHEVAEMALVKLYETTKNDKYLELAKYFIDERGKKPYYFDKENSFDENKNRGKVSDWFATVETQYEYHQAHLPTREQDEAVGHAVRAVYLYSGMADIARVTGDKELLNACKKLWKNIVDKKLYITAGIGATHHGEAFSSNYYLPNDTVYAETCASIGLVFFARRMLQIEPNSEYADIMERALYNGILSGMSRDGKSFFYVNPLEVEPEACRMDFNKKHVLPVRPKWFGCACCPPNLARLITSIGSYVYTENDDSLFVHMYMGSEVKKHIGSSEVTVKIQSNMPWCGKVKFTVNSTENVEFTLALRVPDWCKGKYTLSIADKVSKIENGYIYITKVWGEDESFEIDFDMQTRMFRSNPLVRENIGKVSVMRGAVVYCIEEADNGKNLHLLSLADKPEFTQVKENICGDDVVTITAKGEKIEIDTTDLYTADVDYKTNNVDIKLIPYYIWANRGEGEMMVWIKK